MLRKTAPKGPIADDYADIVSRLGTRKYKITPPPPNSYLYTLLAFAFNQPSHYHHSAYYIASVVIVFVSQCPLTLFLNLRRMFSSLELDQQGL
jgi:hypothetical protein